MLDKYLIKNGTVMSVLDETCRKADILVEKGIVTKIAENIEPEGAEVFDAEGMYVSTGWLDSHCHFADYALGKGIDPVDALLKQGVTYALDLGSVGPDNYEEARRLLRYTTDLRYMSYLNIAHLGIGGAANHMDFACPQDIIPERVIEIAERYRRELCGLKARIDDKFCFDPVYVMEQMRALADRLDMKIAVHAPRSRIGIEKLLTYLKEGDVLSHTLAGNSDVMKVIDEKGNILPCVLEARDRGVIFDLSHGTNAYCYETAEAAWKAGFFTDTVSSDLHGGNLHGPVFNLGVVMTKVRGLTGMSWNRILNKTVAEPVRLQNITGKALEIREGEKADMTVFRIENGAFTYPDSKKELRTFNEKIEAVYTCLNDKVYVCRSMEELQ